MVKCEYACALDAYSCWHTKFRSSIWRCEMDCCIVIAVDVAHSSSCSNENTCAKHVLHPILVMTNIGVFSSWVSGYSLQSHYISLKDAMCVLHMIRQNKVDNKERVYGNFPLIATWTNRSCRWIKMCQFPFLYMQSPFTMENGPSFLPQGFLRKCVCVLDKDINAALSRHS